MRAPKFTNSNSSGTDKAPREVELKLELAFVDAERLLEHPILARAHPLPDQAGSLHAIYYDTQNHALRRAGLSLRIRRRNGHAIQTIKAEREPRGLALDRGEWEHPVDDGLDFDAAAGTPLAPFAFDEAAREKIQPVFTVETDRKAFEIERDGTMIELALDQAKIVAGSRSTQFFEVELELKKGDPAALFATACDLADVVPLRLAPVTKSERGYGLLEEVAAEPIHAAKVELPANATCAEAFQIIARSCLTQMVLNEALLRRGRAPGALHQMRVGLRRLRAAVSLFGDMLASKETDAIKDDFRQVGNQLGAARDLDVFLDRLHTSKESDLDDSQLSDLERRRSEAYETLLETLESHRFMRATLRAAAWIESGKWLTGKKAALKSARRQPVIEHAADEMARRWKRARKLAGRLADFNAEERHELRIRIKKLRYGAEFFASLFTSAEERKRRKSLLAVLERLQEILGEMNDIAVGGALIPALSDTDPERAERRMKKLLSRAEASASKLSKTQPFWK
jgi:triphosphatase